MADTTKHDEKPEGFDKLDRLFRGVVTVSNKSVQKKMATEKAARARARQRTKKRKRR
jgi:hypothetical protein